MTSAVLVASVSLTAGFVCLLRWAFPATPPLRTVIARVDGTQQLPDGTDRARFEAIEWRLGVGASRLLAELGFDASTRRQSDLAVMERSAEEHMGTKAALAVLGSMLVLGPSVIQWSIGRPGVPGAVPLTVTAALIGFFLPDLELHRKARRRRAELAAVIGFDSRVARVMVAGGEGIETALTAASRFGDSWAHVLVRRAMSEVPGRSAREALVELGWRLASPEAENLGNAVTMAQLQGTPLLGALASIGRTIRVDRLREAEAVQARKTVWMSAPVGLMLLGYMGMFVVALVAQVIAVFNI